jgi:hypothetical protein
LGLVAGVLWAGAVSAAAQDAALQKRVAARVPLDQIPEGMRERVRQVLEHPTLCGHGPAEAFAGQPALYDWLLDHPDRGVQAWRRMGARCTEIADRGQGRFGWTDGHGSEILWQTVHNSPTLRVWYAEGKVRPGRLLPAVPVQLVILMRHGKRAVEPDHTLIFHQSHAFVLTDSKAATVVTRMLGDSAPRMAEQCLGQMETFFSSLVWYLDQHPERAEKLLGEGRPTTP